MPCQAEKTAPRGLLWALHATEDPISRALLRLFRQSHKGSSRKLIEDSALGFLGFVVLLKATREGYTTSLSRSLNSCGIVTIAACPVGNSR